MLSHNGVAINSQNHNFLVAKGRILVYDSNRFMGIGHMAELVDALVSGTSGATLGSSSLLMPTICLKKSFWGCSSVGRALRSQCRGREFESHQLHHPSH